MQQANCSSTGQLTIEHELSGLNPELDFNWPVKLQFACCVRLFTIITLLLPYIVAHAALES